MHRIFKVTLAVILIALCTLAGNAADPMATHYSMTDCQGSLRPYPDRQGTVRIPDSLSVIYLSHVGRHGSRYPAGSANCLKMRQALEHADSLGTITPLGKDMLALTRSVIAASNNRWGALDSLGMAEQRAIASRMFAAYSNLIGEGCTVNAIASYSPRVMMSMFSFIHQLDRLNNRANYLTSAGRMNSPLLRPFDVDPDYLEFRRENIWEPPYSEYISQACPITAVVRVLGRDYPFGDTDAARDLAITQYYVVAGLEAMEMPSQMSKYFTPEEANALWSCFNLRQYLQRTATTVSTVPADIASQLLLDIVTKADAAVDGSNPATIDLRFGHAETLMPLLSLLHLPGCYYMTNYFDTVASHWRDFYVVPMAANIQFIFTRAKNGQVYVRTDLNEEPVTLIPGDDRLYIPWGDARAYILRCIPLHLNTL